MYTPKLAIITLVFNRATKLHRLYNSLKTQTCKDFTWYVVDDGSTDNSWDVITSMAESAPFTLKTFSKPNGGKHTAVNLAIRNVEEPLSFIVDSDDWLPSSSVEAILRCFEESVKRCIAKPCLTTVMTKNKASRPFIH